MTIVLFFAMLYLSSNAIAQVRGKIVEMDAEGTFVVSIISEQTWAPPNSFTTTAAFTLKVPTGTFLVKKDEVVSHNGLWELASRIKAPIEAPTFDYIYFYLVSPITTLTYTAGEEIPLFSFKNTEDCPGDVQIMDPETDPFKVPNSLSVNIGNNYTIVGNGLGNGYKGTIKTKTNEQNCHLEYDWSYNENLCYGDSTKGVLTFLKGIPPLRVVLKSVEPNRKTHYFIDTLTHIGDQFIMSENLLEGSHSLFLIDGAPDTVFYNFDFEQPKEVAVLASRKELGCNDTTGVLVRMIHSGLPEGDVAQYSWSNGHNGDVLEDAGIGAYQVTMTYGRECSLVHDFNVEGVPPIEITVKEQKNPSCDNIEDGLIDIEVTGGVDIFYFYEWGDSTLGVTNKLTSLEGGLYTVTVADVTGCKAVQEILLDTPPPLEPTITVKSPSCPDFEDGHVEIRANENGALPFKYSFGGGSLKNKGDYPELGAGAYKLYVVDDNDCIMEKDLVLEEPEEFEIELGENREVLIGEKRTLIQGDTLDNSYEFYWEPSESLTCFDCPNPIASPLETTTYQVFVTSEKGCFRTDEVTINVNRDRPVFFPNAFSPDGDGYNDYFEIPLGKTTTAILELKVLNRWGQLVYESNSTQGPIRWDGYFDNKMVPEGVYMFFATILFDDGETLPFQGDVLLVR